MRGGAIAASMACAALIVSNAPAQTGGGYYLTWSTVDCGGITFAANGPYEIGGTIGQPDAGVLANGGYEAIGGFWAFVIPDQCDSPECVQFIGGCAADRRWSCPANWDLGGAIYPDNGPVTTYSVTLDATDLVCVDVPVTIDTLQIIESASLDMSGAGGCVGNLKLAQPGGLLLDAVAGTSGVSTLTLAGGRTISEAPGTSADLVIRNNALLQVDDSAINLTGNGLIEFGGRYEPITGTEDGNAAALAIGNLTIRYSYPGGLFLDGEMSAIVTGNFVMDGRNVPDGMPCFLGAGGTVAGGYTPPIVRIKKASTGWFGDLICMGASTFILNPTEPLTTPITISGNFDNQSIRHDCVACRNGGFLLNGTSPQLFEVAGTDVGRVGSVSGTEFVLGALEVAPASQVTFRDAFDNNRAGQAPCSEAQYVDKLTLGAGSSITIDNCRVYYQTLVQGAGAAVTLIGCGELLSVGSPDAPNPPGADPTGINKPRFISFSVPSAATAAASETALRVTLLSLHHPDPPYTGGASVQFAAFEGQTMWVSPPMQYVESASSGTPFYASQLQCTPHYQDWTTITLLHVTGEAIVPSSFYEVQNLAASCAGNEAACAAASAPLLIKTTRWGDVATPYNPPATDPQPDTSDISALVNKFKSALGAPIKARALLFGDSRGRIDIAPDLNFSHISACVDAFKGLPYPYKPGKCAGDAAKACVSDADCTAQSVTGPCVLCP